MEVIILIALIFVILNLANKYLKVPRDGNQRYDGINNRFYGEGYTGDTPVPPADDEDLEDGREDLQDEQADEGTESGENEIGTDDAEKPVQQDLQPIDNMEDQPANQQPDSRYMGGSEKEAPAGDAAIYGNIGNTPGVVIDTEVHIDATMPQDRDKS